MTIGEVARRCDLAASAIRYYEQVGLLAAPTRTSGKRAYDPDVLHQLVIIRFAIDTGFKLQEIKMLLRGFPSTTPASLRWKKMASGKIKELDDHLARVRAMKKMLKVVMSCRCRSLAQCSQDLVKRPKGWSFPEGKTRTVGRSQSIPGN